MVTRQARGAVPLQTHKEAQALLVGRGTAAPRSFTAARQRNQTEKQAPSETSEDN